MSEQKSAASGALKNSPKASGSGIINRIRALWDQLKQNDLIGVADRFAHSPKLKTRVRQWSWAIIRTIFVLGFCYIILYPVLIMLSKAFMHIVDIYDSTVILIPKHFTFMNIRLAGMMINYPVALKNSLILATVVTALQTAACMVVGYGFARFKFRFRGLLFGLVIFTIVVPPQLIMVSIYLHFRFFDILGIVQAINNALKIDQKGVNLLDTFWPFFLLAITAQGIKNGLFVYIFRQFFRNMPKETEEAALVDGAGVFRTFGQIMLPDALTAVITVALFSFVWQYNDQTYAQLFLKNTKVLPMTYEYLGQFSTELSAYSGLTLQQRSNTIYIAMLRSTGVFIMMLPPCILYAFMQRYFVQSIERTGVVG